MLTNKQLLPLSLFSIRLLIDRRRCRHKPDTRDHHLTLPLPTNLTNLYPRRPSLLQLQYPLQRLPTHFSSWYQFPRCLRKSAVITLLLA